jgi:hypothetical protein
MKSFADWCSLQNIRMWPSDADESVALAVDHPSWQFGRLKRLNFQRK